MAGFWAGGVGVAIAAATGGLVAVLLRRRARHKTTLKRLRRENEALHAERDATSETLSTFAEGARDFLWRVDADGRLRDVSAATGERLGMAPDELEGREFAALTAPHAAGFGDTDRGLAADLFARRPFAGSKAVIAGRSGRRTWSISGRPILDKNGDFAGFVGVASDVTEAERIADFDILTGLHNRAHFEREALARLALRRYRNEWSALIRVDLGRVAWTNEALGRDGGDALLRLAAERLQRALAPGDLAARLGGDEFIVLAAEVQTGEGARLASKIVASLAAPYEIDGVSVEGAPAVGLTLAPADGEELAHLSRRAELALLRAKADGGGWRRYEPGPDNAAQALRQLEQDLAVARQEGRLELAYQPVVELQSGAIRGFEALLRWRHPTLGLIAPADFIPIAERTGQIVAMGVWALNEACREAARWPGEIRVAVNVSPTQFHSGAFAAEVVKALASTRLPPERLELELTESVLIGDREATRRALETLRGLGVRISLDDFGAGYASFGYLCSFPFDKIKIDQSFLSETAISPVNRAVVKSIAALADELGLTLVVEGVDSVEQRDWLVDVGCREAQGFLFGRPTNALEVERLIVGPIGPPVSRSAA